MKGTATITLTDAKTGEILSRTVEHNMVTNALTNIFNPVNYSLLHEFDYSALFREGLPVWKQVIAGVMLLGNTVEEDADNILLGPDTIPVGTAGTEYAGTNIYRGTLNLNETYETENGYHFTWDFGTDKANGTIRCVALTSKNFGDAGFHSESEDIGSYLINPAYMDVSDLEPSTRIEYGQGQYLGTFEAGVHLFAELNTDGDMIFRRYRGVDPSALRLGDRVGLQEVSAPCWETSMTPDFAIEYDDRYFLDPDTRIIYYFGETEGLTEDSMNITFTGISLDTFTTVLTRTVTIPVNCTNYYLGAVWNDHIFYLTPDGLCEFDMNGDLLNTYEAPYAQTTLFFVQNGCLMSQSPTGFIYCYSWGETTSTALSRYLFPSPNIDAKAPYAAVHRRRPHCAGERSIYTDVSVAIVSSYMATINNLSSPIVKTSEQTLKISYDITN